MSEELDTTEYDGLMSIMKNCLEDFNRKNDIYHESCKNPENKFYRPPAGRIINPSTHEIAISMRGSAQGDLMGILNRLSLYRVGNPKIVAAYHSKRMAENEAENQGEES